MKEKQATPKAKRKSSVRSRKRPKNAFTKTKEMSYVQAVQAVQAMYEDSDRTLLPKFRRCEECT